LTFLRATFRASHDRSRATALRAAHHDATLASSRTAHRARDSAQAPARSAINTALRTARTRATCRAHAAFCARSPPHHSAITLERDQRHRLFHRTHRAAVCTTPRPANKLMFVL
jgi:hypothetical protein